ncbi:glycosyltransferase [Allokutzneria oryzae]|uniref:Glycosyltransferase n=1 Tax=Allokutzneria oryzae TaxID=1378989 RepID=A0ABV6ABW9_9PSEU
MLCTVTGSPSHTRSLVPITRALAARGHDVLVVVPEDFVELLAAENLTTAGVLYGMRERLRDMMAEDKQPLHPASNPGDMSTIVRVMAGPLAVDAYQRALPLAEEFRPDVVVRDDAEFGGLLLAEKLGIPHICLPGGFSNVGDPVIAAEALAEHVRLAGLDVELGPDCVYRHGRIDYVPTEFSFTAVDAPLALAYRQPVLVRPGERLPAWLTEVPADKPLVLAAIGTALPLTTKVDKEKLKGPKLPAAFANIDPAKRLRTVIEALAGVDCTAVVATGGVPVPDAPIAPNVHLVEHVPQPLVLECADLFVTHGGYNGIREALRAGVPMVVQPAFGDQPSNSDRVEELGLGLRIHDGAVEEIRSACTRVLTEPRFAARAAQAKRAMLALPDLDQAVMDIEAVVKGSPVPA